MWAWSLWHLGFGDFGEWDEDELMTSLLAWEAESLGAQYRQSQEDVAFLPPSILFPS